MGGSASSHATRTATESAVATLEAPASSPSDEPSTTAAPWWALADATAIEPVPVQRPTLDLEGHAFENLLISHFDGHNLSMPTIPLVVDQALRLLRDRRCDFQKVAQLIGEDQVLAAAVLRMANSAYYRGTDKITAVKPAIVRIGSKALQTLMLHQALRAATLSVQGEYNNLAQLLWHRSLASSCVMRSLSRFTGVDPDEAALIGLLHDIGCVIVLRLAVTEDQAGRYTMDLDAFEFFCFESHQEFGELIADEWKLPDRLKSLIVDHHRHPNEDDPFRTERLQLQLCDMVNAMVGYGPAMSYDLLNARCVKDLGLSDRSDFTEYLTGLPNEIDEAVASP